MDQQNEKQKKPTKQQQQEQQQQQQPLPRPSPRQPKTKQWVRRWRMMVRPTSIRGVWERQEGGHLVRSRITDPTTGHKREIKKVLHDADEATAFAWLRRETARIKAGLVSAEQPKMRFAEFAASLFDHKVKVGEIRSARGRDKWRGTLQHLIAGTTGDKAAAHVPGFGDVFVDMLRIAHVEQWREGIAGLIAAGDYSPTTANGWLGVLRVVTKAAKRQLGLRHNATEDVKNFDTSEHVTYSEEEPNALLPEEAPAFLGAMRAQFPQHYAMVYLGLATGLRPSSLRPLRRSGPNADVLWDQNRIWVRRSHSLGDEVMNTTKQRRRYPIDVPQEVMDVLRWHVATQLPAPEQQESELLFPSVSGGFRSPSVLNKPFAEVAVAIGLGRQLTQRGLRRTFNDLARAAQVEAIVTRSISGHLTEQMQHHYSTVNPKEQRDGIARVIDLMKAREASTGASGAQSGAQGSKVVLKTKKTG